MFYYSIDSKEKVVHYEGCHHLKNIKKGNLKSFDSIHDVRKSEYRLCSCCSPITEHLRKEQSELENYCLENGMLYFVHKGNLHIRTHHSKWKVLASNSKGLLELHHANSYEKEHDNSVPGYHKQNFFSDSVLGYLEYINEHEYYRMLNPVLHFRGFTRSQCIRICKDEDGNERSFVDEDMQDRIEAKLRASIINNFKPY